MVMFLLMAVLSLTAVGTGSHKGQRKGHHPVVGDITTSQHVSCEENGLVWSEER